MPRDTLTRERIVNTAIQLLDAEGLEGLNMRSLGEQLDSAATAVYWHVKSKDNLVMLAGDQVWKEIELPDLDTGDWRTSGMTMAKDLYAMFTRHPWLVQAMGTHLFQGPGKARHDDHSLAIYEQAGFVGARADQALTTVYVFVLGSAMGGSAAVTLRRKLRRDGRDPEKLIRETLAQATEIAMQFPRLRARLESVDLDDADYYAAPEQSFEYGLEAIFDGLERQLKLGSAAPRPQGNGWYA
ncbi:MAG TPA: TetR/AcrR family transcriptional regulator C-terminal domain-containing protein [Actinophytocola sp.]|uniref:TetR/AcrR family transcriptional regulator C-terminal domain-containing protein n=1 Tax=Actinophytocola sp. TaxID=1872138 RepID=UPI002DB9B5BC|nr:TetR/AcrR family transcriptional regulator C-terminal domain-containing protein [Actinophytocola sp.]HEU5471989.1 TetR/AcrR family transcriptional regulator C-terminal domain-containing protein [Actinophytocola sp.]